MHINNKSLDANQKEIKELIDKIAVSINKPKTFTTKVKSLFGFSRHDFNLNIYLYGKVGRGKTMLMNYFYDQVKIPKKIVHFQKFMKDLHMLIHKSQLNNVPLNLIIKNIAKDLADSCKVLCIDEFEIHDIADAMMVMQLFRFLHKYEVAVFITTNTDPSHLYKDGLQRQSFLPFIDEIYNKFQILNLDQEHDYRYLNMNSKKRIFAPQNESGELIVRQLKKDIANGDSNGKSIIKIFGREVVFESSVNGAIFTDFAELFERELSYVDYSEITSEYKIFVVENVRKIQDSETDIVLRFINFVDNAYYNRTLLILTSECALEEIYGGGKKKSEFERTISRLVEMNNSQYKPNI